MEMTRHKNIQQGVNLHGQAVDIEKALRVLQSHDGELAISVNTYVELTQAAIALNDRAIGIIEDNNGEAGWAKSWAQNKLDTTAERNGK